MRKAAVIGAGMSKFGTRNLTAPALFREAMTAAVGSVDRGLAVSDIEEAWIGSLGFGGGQLGNLSALLVDESGARGIPAQRVENACASSGFAFRNAVMAVRSGEVDVALAGGIEIMNDLAPVHQRYWLGVSGDTLWERLAGATFPGVYALLAQRHMHEFGTKREHLASVAVKNHANGARNPKAQFQKEITLERALAGANVASPLTVFDCCSTTDGASAVLVASEEAARRFTDTPVWVTGAGAATDTLALHDRESLTSLAATTAASRAAYEQAGIGPRDVHVAEVHDCFTIAEILAVEDLGFVGKGKGGPWTQDGRSARDGEIAVNPSGGLKAKGHPLGATGTAQVTEVFLQLRGEAGQRQRAGAEVGLTHNVGGSGATCTVHVFRRG
ncbi:MAG: thiolase domain-containing protein [Thermoplasmatota archaeon]